MTEEKKKVAIYARVSTGKQELDNQLVQLRAHCMRKKWEITFEYCDILTGKSDRRPKFIELFEHAHKGYFDLVLFWDLSRFSRLGTLHTMKRLEELKTCGVDWVSYNEPYLDTMGEFRDVIISLMATVAKIERQKIVDRTNAGLNRARRKGKKLGRPAGTKDKKKRYRRYHKKPYWVEE